MFRHPIAIDPRDIDHMGHVNNAVYLTWVQAAVVECWQKLAPAEAVAKHLWIALRHEIDYRKPAFLHDEVVADVIADRARGARAFFTTIVRRGEDVLAEIKSTWCCVDAVTQRPTRLAREISDRFMPHQGRPPTGDQAG